MQLWPVLAIRLLPTLSLSHWPAAIITTAQPLLFLLPPPWETPGAVPSVTKHRAASHTAVTDPCNCAACTIGPYFGTK